MVFSSYIFLFYFLPLALLVYYAVPRRAKHVLLTLMSYLFYGWANPAFVFLMFLSTTIDFVCGLVIARGAGQNKGVNREALVPGTGRSRSQRAALFVSIASNLSLLGFFKYFNFGVENYNALVDTVGLGHLQWDTFFRVTLPLGISFYTFQSMSYSIDVYRGHARAVRNFTDFSCYVTMFPQLVAGPIVRFHEVANQLQDRAHTSEKFARGVAFFCLGMAKKILIANPCGKIADICFDAGGRDVLDAWYGLFAYSFQIYFDFSAYSDMAIGLGLFFGFVFPKNFDSPYKSKSITEFWQRWHMSLSHFLRDYLYIPLGGNRKGDGRTYVNLAMVMLLGGLWHGASWNFVAWGGIHGGMLAFERMQGKESFYRRLPGPFRVAITFVIASIAWVFFRSENIAAAGTYLLDLVGMGERFPGAGLIHPIIHQSYYYAAFLTAGFFAWFMPQTWDFTRRLNFAKAAWCFGVFYLAIAVMVTQEYNPFIYFIF
ncbi:MAG: MBOAT family O-acyltransferase [Candidatus Hydrogenedentota bacterium]